jgi:FSR family fosmidomycin resistance protein-like MFS transporter
MDEYHTEKTWGYALSPHDSRNDTFQTGRVITISSGHAVHDTYTAFLPPLLPIFIANLALSKAEAGLLTVFTQAPSLMQPVIGHLADRTRHQHWVFLSPGITAALMSTLVAMPNYFILSMILTCVGLSSAVFHAVGPVIAGRLSGSRLGRGMSYWMVGGELGRALGPIVIVTMIRYFTLEGVPYLMGFGLLASLVLVLRVKAKGHSVPRHAEELHWRLALKRMRPVMVPVVGLILVRGLMFGALTIFLPTYLSEQGKSLWLAGASLTIVQAAGALGALLGGTMSDKLGRRFVLFITLLITPIMMLVFLRIEGLGQLPLLVIMGVTLISTTPVIMALVQENFPENRALANGVYMSLSFVIRSSMVVAVGFLGDIFGLHIAFTVSSVIMLMGVPLVFLLPGDRPRQGPPQDREKMTLSMEV